MQRARTFMDMDSEDSEVTARPRVVNRDQGYLHPSLGLCNRRYLFSNPLPLSTPLCQNTCLMFLRLPRQSPILFLIISRYIKWSLTGEKKKERKKRPRMHMCRIPSPKRLTPLRNHNHAKKPKTSLPPPKDHTNPRTLATPHSISSFGLLELFSTLLDPPTPAPTPIGVPTPAAPLKTLHTTSTAPRISSPQGPSNWNERNARRAFSMRAFPRGRRMYW